MGVQLNLQDIQSGFLSAAAHTANNTLIETAMDKTLDRTGTVNNAMLVDLDMGNQKIINLADGVNNKDAVNLQQLNGALAAAGGGLIASQIETQLGAQAVSRVFTLTGITYTVGGNNLYVFRNGQKLAKGRDYTETSSSSITLTFDPNDDDDFDFITNISTTSSTSQTSSINHTENSTSYDLDTYLQNGYIVNVKDFGATGAGIVNDQPAIQAAIDYLAATSEGGGIVYLPEGKYYVTSEITVPNGIYLKGAGRGRTGAATGFLGATTIFAEHTGNSVLNLKGSVSVKLADFNIETSLSTFPKTGLLLGRSSAASAGHHNFQFLRIQGAFSVAPIYSIASEVNTWQDIYVDNLGTGNAKYCFYTAQEDALFVDDGVYTGTDNTSSSAAFMTDTTASFSVNALVGRLIRNVTDGSYGKITANDATTVTATLAGGTTNTWNSGDSYSIGGLITSSNVDQTMISVYLLNQNTRPDSACFYKETSDQGASVAETAGWTHISCYYIPTAGSYVHLHNKNATASLGADAFYNLKGERYGAGNPDFGIRITSDTGFVLPGLTICGSRLNFLANTAGAGGLISGTDNTSSAAAFMTDSTASFTTNALVGYVIENETDGSYGVITANTATTVTATLQGGTNNNWDSGDTYTIKNRYSMFVESNVSMTNPNVVMQHAEAFPYAIDKYRRSAIKGGVFQIGRVANWTAPTLLNSWTNSYGSPYSQVGYSMDAMGNVHIRGVVSGGTGAIMTLPKEIRPQADHVFVTICGASGSEQLGKLRVSASTGDVTMLYGTNSELFLDSIKYRVG